MKIAFIGDSFCSEGHKASWCGIVTKNFDAKVIPLGQSGSNDVQTQFLQTLNICFI